MRQKIRILIVDDHRIVRKGLAALLGGESDLEIIGEAANGRDAVAAYARLSPDVVLMDLVMPVMSGAEAINRIIGDDPGARILVLTSYAGDEQLFPALKSGALGYLLKDAEVQDVVAAIRHARDGETTLAPSITRRILRELKAAPPDVEHQRLSRREQDVLRLVAHGLSNRDIGERLFISEPTVRTHLASIFTKVDVNNRTQAALYALRSGLVALDELDHDPA